METRALPVEAVRHLLRKQLAECLGGQRALAARIGISQAYLSDVLRGHRTPGPSILKFLGLTRAYIKQRRTP